MGYIRNRMLQPSTWFGIMAAGMALVASKGAVTPEVTSALLAAAGLVHINEGAAQQPPQ